jgi:predicted PurR-regulated permease PerM
MARNAALEKADARRNALFVLPMTLFAVLLVALPLIYVLGTSLVQSGQDFSTSIPAGTPGISTCLPVKAKQKSSTPEKSVSAMPIPAGFRATPN